MKKWPRPQCLFSQLLLENVESLSQVPKSVYDSTTPSNPGEAIRPVMEV